MTPSPQSARAVIFGVAFLDLVGFGIVIPILPIYAQQFGASPLIVGLLLGVYSAMQCIGAPLLGRLSDRIGRRPVLLVSIIGTAVGFLLMGLANSLALLFIARIIDGITGGNISTAQAYIADITPPQERSKGMGLIGAAFGLGFIFGPAIGGVLSRWSAAAPFFFAAVLAGLNAIAAAWLLPESLPPEARHRPRERRSVRDAFDGPHGRSLALIIATYFCTTVAFSLLTATYPLFTKQQFGYGATQNGWLFATIGLIGAIVQGGLLGWLLRRTSDHRLALIGLVLLMTGLLLLPWTGTAGALWIATAVLATGHGLAAAPLNGLASKQTSHLHHGQSLGLMQSAASVARIVGPVLGGWLLNYDSVHALIRFGRSPYWTGAFMMACACLLLSISSAKSAA